MALHAMHAAWELQRPVCLSRRHVASRYLSAHILQQNLLLGITQRLQSMSNTMCAGVGLCTVHQH